MAASCLGGAAQQSGDRDAFVQWAAPRTAPVSGLGAMVGDARVVALGEANHAARSWLDQPQRLRAYGNNESIVTPSSAFDIVVAQERQTPARSSASSR